MADATQTLQGKFLNPLNNILEKAKDKIENTHLSDHVKMPNFFGRAKEDIEALVEPINQDQQKELITEGKGVRDQSTEPENSNYLSVKGSNVFEQSKVAMKGIVDALKPKKQLANVNSSIEIENDEGVWAVIGTWLEKVCCVGRQSGNTKKD